MTADDPPVQWSSVEKLVRLYAWITLAGVLYGVLVAHVPFMIGHPWTSCDDSSSPLACVLVFHLYEIPLTLFNAWVGWYGLKRFSRGSARSYAAIIIFAVIANLVFFTFESILLMNMVKVGSPQWESWGVASVALMLVGGGGFGVYVHQKLIPALNQ